MERLSKRHSTNQNCPLVRRNSDFICKSFKGKLAQGFSCGFQDSSGGFRPKSLSYKNCFRSCPFLRKSWNCASEISCTTHEIAQFLSFVCTTTCATWRLTQEWGTSKTFFSTGPFGPLTNFFEINRSSSNVPVSRRFIKMVLKRSLSSSGSSWT